ncbi:hypothetical protein MATL_G00158540 [Megalops atlanticus]|uniref:Uncharacterized protein n=1 Tax=Megalops atlanticus TaxID=7932 RepID=A0A9D3PV49_MEGAT|nr:hypothetical protein MATL_G00158540 [Megalops atlanticus]
MSGQTIEIQTVHFCIVLENCYLATLDEMYIQRAAVEESEASGWRKCFGSNSSQEKSGTEDVKEYFPPHRHLLIICTIPFSKPKEATM